VSTKARALRIRAACVAVRNDRVAVVCAAFHPVQFIATARPHFVIPELTVCIKGQTQRIAMPDRPELRSNAALFGERVISGNTPVWFEPNNLAQVLLHVLGGIKFLPFTRANKQETIGRESNALTEMTSAGYFG